MDYLSLLNTRPRKVLRIPSPESSVGALISIVFSLEQAIIIRTSRSEDAMVAKTPLKKLIYLLAVFIEIIPSGVEFLRSLSKFRERNNISSSVDYVLHEMSQFHDVVVQKGKEMNKKVWCRVKLLFCLLNLLLFFFKVLVAIASSDR